MEKEIIELDKDIVYDTDKDFYKGIGGELRLKAEGLFKKAKEKGISIEEIDITKLREGSAGFPGLGMVELPAYIIKVKGKHVKSGQVILDGKQIDYYNSYQKYMAERIEKKNLVRDEKGRLVRENNKPKVKGELDLALTDWEMFDIGKTLVEDKEFGMEKTITGACDRVIRKLMGENDWLYPEEARLLEEEFNDVQDKIARSREGKSQPVTPVQKKATERQINYFKAKLKNSGIDPESEAVINEVIRQSGFNYKDIGDLSMAEMSRIIDSLGDVIHKVKETLKRDYMSLHRQEGLGEQPGDGIKQ